MLGFMGLKNILVINDEVHHCYREKPGEGQEAEKNREATRIWISGTKRPSGSPE